MMTATLLGMLRQMTGGRFPRVREDTPLACPEVGRMLQRLLDGNLDDPAHKQALRRHLDDCARCGIEHDVYVKLKTSLEHNRDASLDAEAVDRLRDFGRSLTADDS